MSTYIVKTPTLEDMKKLYNFLISKKYDLSNCAIKGFVNGESPSWVHNVKGFKFHSMHDTYVSWVCQEEMSSYSTVYTLDEFCTKLGKNGRILL